MSTSPHSPQVLQFCLTMLLGLVMAGAIAVFAEPESAWMGFVMAGIHRSISRRRKCLPGPGVRGGA